MCSLLATTQSSAPPNFGVFWWIVTILVTMKRLGMPDSHAFLLVATLCRASNCWTCSRGIKPAEGTSQSSWTLLQFEGYVFLSQILVGLVCKNVRQHIKQRHEHDQSTLDSTTSKPEGWRCHKRGSFRLL